MRQKAKQWQSKALRSLSQEHARGRRAALLQLPPGQGKTLVAVRHFKRLMQSDYRLLVATPTRDIRYFQVWQREFERDLGPSFRSFNTLKKVLWDRGYRAAVVSHRELNDALRGCGPPIVNEWLRKRRKLLIVVDELHRAADLKIDLARAYWDDMQDFLPRCLRQATGNLRWLLLSATPYNPVRLDYDVDRPGHDFQGDVEAIQEEADQVADEVKLTLGALAWLSGHPKDRQLLQRYTDAIRSIMASDDGHVEVPKPPVAIVPKEASALRPAPPSAYHVKPEAANMVDSVRALSNIHRRLADHPDLSIRTATAERLALGGVPRPPRGSRSLCRHKYSAATVRATAIAASAVNPAASGVKMAALEALLRRISKEKGFKVLIFCVHRAVASAVVEHLRNTRLFADTDVVDATRFSGADLDSRCRGFNSVDGTQCVMVTSDKLSESIDLHRACSCLVHFELPWSPLRVLQRVGRLWRIRSDEQKRPSRAPRVFHVVHPCSVEEEILNRLRRRWDYLKVLGLDYMPKRYGLGTRIPRVPWETTS